MDRLLKGALGGAASGTATRTKRTAELPDSLIAPGKADALLKTGALRKALFNSANFSSIATDARGVIQKFNVGAGRMLGYAAAEVILTAANRWTLRRHPDGAPIRIPSVDNDISDAINKPADSERQLMIASV
jgi:PAS domain-containing protein